jgi:dihydroorotate dehydrogenase (fumarate)
MDLSTDYLGLKLPHPLMPGASPLVDELDTVRQLEDAGASAIVMRSLFEEQVVGEQLAASRHMDTHAESSAEARSYFPDSDVFAMGPDEYLEQIRKIKETVGVPVIASLNGATEGGWLQYSRLMQDAGADALELNVYLVATDPDERGEVLEQRAVDMLRSVKSSVRIPVAVKLSPFYSSVAHFGKRLDDAGADGLVLFNRFYQADIDVEQLQVVRTLELSDSSELLLRLRWLAVLSGRIRGSLAVTGGVHTATDAIKAVMTGAHAVHLVSALFRNGVQHLRTVRDQMAAWLEEHEYESLRQMQGSMNLSRCPDAKAFERANYALILQGWEA